MNSIIDKRFIRLDEDLPVEKDSNEKYCDRISHKVFTGYKTCAKYTGLLLCGNFYSVFDGCCRAIKCQCCVDCLSAMLYFIGFIVIMPFLALYPLFVCLCACCKPKDNCFQDCMTGRDDERFGYGNAQLGLGPKTTKSFIDRVSFWRGGPNNDSLVFSYVLTTGWSDLDQEMICGEWTMNLGGGVEDNWTKLNRHLYGDTSDDDILPEDYTLSLTTEGNDYVVAQKFTIRQPTHGRLILKGFIIF